MPTLVLADGTKIDTATGEVVDDTLPSTEVIEDDDDTPSFNRMECNRRTIADLPAPPQQLNTIAVILTYHLFGLSDADIAHIINFTPSQVRSILESDASMKLQDTMLSVIREHDTSVIRRKLSEYEERAAKTIGELLKSSNVSASVRLSAAKDILDRSGHRPVDIVEHRHKIDGGLVIEVVQRSGNNQIPGLVLDGEIVNAIVQ